MGVFHAITRSADRSRQRWHSQATLDEIVEHGAPSLSALAAHALDREQHLLAVRAHPEDNEERDRGRRAGRRGADSKHGDLLRISSC